MGSLERAGLEEAASIVGRLFGHNANIEVEVETWDAPAGQPAIRASQEESVALGDARWHGS